MYELCEKCCDNEMDIRVFIEKGWWKDEKIRR